MKVPFTISPNVCEAYRCSASVAHQSYDCNRTIRAESESWDDTVIPDLKVLAIRAIATAWRERPILNELPTCMDKNALIEMLPTDLPFPLVIEKISDDHYWRRAANDRWEYNNLFAHGNSWRQLYCERHIAEYLEKLQPDGFEDQEENCQKLIALLENYVYTLRIRSLISTRKPMKNVLSDDEDPCAMEEDIVHHIPIGKLFPIFSRLTEIYLQFGIIYMNDGFEWKDFEFSLQDAKRIGDGVKDCSNLRKFSLTRSNLDQPRAAAILQGLAANKSVEELDFSHCKLADSGAHAVGQFLLMHERLRVLNLTNNNIGWEGLAGIIHGLLQAELTSLEHLNLRLNPLHDTGATYICSLLLRNESLKILNISTCNLCTEGGIQIAEVISSEDIKFEELNIDLSNNDLGPMVGEAFEVAMKSCLCIISLDIRMCNFSKKSEYYISQSVFRNREAVKQNETVRRKNNDFLSPRDASLWQSLDRENLFTERKFMDRSISVQTPDKNGTSATRLISEMVCEKTRNNFIKSVPATSVANHEKFKASLATLASPDIHREGNDDVHEQSSTRMFE